MSTPSTLVHVHAYEVCLAAHTSEPGDRANGPGLVAGRYPDMKHCTTPVNPRAESGAS